MGQFKESCSKVGDLSCLKLFGVLLISSLLSFQIASADIIQSIEELEKLEKQRGRPSPQVPAAPAQTEEEIPDPSSAKPSEETRPQEQKTSPQTQRPHASPTAASPEKDEQARSERAKAPIRLKSDGRSTYSRDGGLIHMRENVVVTQEDLRLTADEAKVFVDNSKEDDRVERVEMIGSVKFNKFDERPNEQVSAHGDRAIFINARQEIELIGNARIWKGNQLIRGKRMIYDIQTGMIEVDQAVGVMQPEEN